MLALGWTLAAFLYFSGLLYFVVQDILDVNKDPLAVMRYRFNPTHFAWPLYGFADAAINIKAIVKVLRR